MVCLKCQKKLDKLITPDAWKEGSRNTTGGKDGGRKIGVNMLLEKKKFKYDPYGAKCKDCKVKVNFDWIYCQSCAYKKGICSMCGIKIMDVKFYRQSNI